MIRLREITGEEQLLESYVAQYERAGGFPLDLAYARKCRAYAFMDGKTRMVGGFLLNPTLPFRALNDMPDEDRQRILARLDLDQAFEVMCLWVEPAVRGSLLMMRFWASVLLVMWRFPKRDLITCTVARALKQLYMGLPVEVLYEGTIRTPNRVLDKYVLLLTGKRGFLRGLIVEALHRMRRWAFTRAPEGTIVPARRGRAVV